MYEDGASTPGLDKLARDVCSSGFGDVRDDNYQFECGSPDRILDKAIMAVALSDEVNAKDFIAKTQKMLEEMEGTREAVAGLQEELSQMRRKGPPGRGKRKGPPRRGGNDSGYRMQQSGGPRRPSLHPADLDGDGFVTEEEKRIYRQKMEQEDDLWEYD